MLNPDNFSPKFWENLRKLKAAGFRLPGDDELPAECRIEGSMTFLVNDQGDIKSVEQGSGGIMDWPYKANK